MSVPAVKRTRPMSVAYLPMHGPYAQIPEGYGHLYGWVEEHGLTPTGMPEVVFTSPPGCIPESEAVFELRAPIAEDGPESGPDTAGVGVKHVCAETVAAAVHKGPYETIDITYRALLEWIRDSGYEVTGPSEESYVSDPADTAPEDTLTEVRVPVRVP